MEGLEWGLVDIMFICGRIRKSWRMNPLRRQQDAATSITKATSTPVIGFHWDFLVVLIIYPLRRIL